MSVAPVFGLFYFHAGKRLSLPLLNVRAEASIKELAAQVKLTQTYGNDAAFPIEATYLFPIPARAAVCGFVMIKQDGSKVVGCVQEKQEARKTYNAAVAQGKQASLMEQQTPDVFQVSVGNIPANEQVQIELVYATELSEDEENDSIRFHLPVHIGARYGHAPQSTASFTTNTVFISASSKTPFLDIAVTVEAIAPISKIGCISHTVSTELGPDPALPNFQELPFSNYARVSLSSGSALDKDFVLTIKSAGLDTPRCVAELHPSPSHNTVAMALTLVPRFKLPDIARQEFIFLVDRSGSMEGQRISAARKALIIMLRSLPHKDSYFQIMSFGSGCTGLWEDGSKPYNQATLEEATKHSRHHDGQLSVGRRSRGRSRHASRRASSIGPPACSCSPTEKQWDLDAVLNEVKAAVARTPPKAPLRVSVLGIGNSVSTAMCEGIARVGNGTCMLVGEQETSITGKIARLLKAARTPIISDISVDWGRPLATLKDTMGEPEDEFDMSVDPTQVDPTLPPPPPPVVLPSPPMVQQAPFTIRNLFPGIRLNLYAILQGRTIPNTVTLRGSTTDGAEIDLPVAVKLSHLQNTPEAPPAVHALAARKIIQDLEDGQHDIAKSLVAPDDTDLLARTVKASIVRLGKTYSISSSHTSFVAVDESQLSSPSKLVAPEPDTVGNLPPPQLLHTPRPPAPLVCSTQLPPPPAPGPPPPPSRALDLSGYDYSAVSSLVLTAERSQLPTNTTTTQLFTADSARVAADNNQSSGEEEGGLEESDDDLRFELMKLDEEELNERLISTALVPTLAAPVRPCSASFDAIISAPESESMGPLESLARLQSFDGCFSLDLLAVVQLKSDIQTVRALFPSNVMDEVVATVLGMAFLSTRLGADVERDSWEAMYEKAKQFVEEALSGIDVDLLEAEVAKLLA
ncbi:vault protein inter-alpha-trypsin domain-containing protein [Mycena rebaudengoi]|nr:vault protein inter-alpha-trypsin domain-containing protein [Mycena rebaudengoi]